MDINSRIDQLLKVMKRYNLDAYIIPTSDYHQSEYLADFFNARQWISGFTGSYGTVIITKDYGHGLWTDGRYYLQAENELKGSDIKLFKERAADVPAPEEWLVQTLNNNAKVGLNGKLFSYKAIKSYEEKFSKKNIALIADHALISEIWQDRPQLPKGTIEALAVEYAGKTRKEKLNEVRKKMDTKKGNIYINSNLADIAWLYNLRGKDVKNNPVFLSYTIIEPEKAVLYLDQSKLSPELIKQLNNDGIEIKGYKEIYEDVKEYSKKKILFDPNMTNVVLIQKINETNEKKEINSIITQLKAVKNPTEINHMIDAHVKDGVAMVKFLYWLEERIKDGEMNEIKAAEKLSYFRSQQALYKDDSFDYISGFGSNGAIVHYKATQESNKTFQDNGFYLIDSGGQYSNGTTDITRTIAIGKITNQMKEDFTLVLKGHINLSTAKFIEGTRGDNLDILARKPLWDRGLNYNHGTGHGVGFYLNVHEGPQTISYYSKSVKLEKGMVISNEPGLYRENEYGIRIENLIYVDAYQATDFGQFYQFKNLTLCPIDLKAIDVNLLTAQEIDWLNSYHEQVFNKLAPYLTKDEKQWLKDNTRRI